MATHGANNGMIPTSSEWYEAEVLDVAAESPCVKLFTLQLPHPAEHLAGQHYELRLTAPNGYQAARLYSAASAGTGTSTVQLAIAYMEGGEVSPYLHDHAGPGFRLDMRGPLGRAFVWDPTVAAPVLLVGGGVGVAPLRAMLQAHAHAVSKAPIHLLYSTRSDAEIIFRSELLTNPAVTVTLTREWPSDWQGKTGRIDAQMAGQVLAVLSGQPMCYICGMTSFVESASRTLLGLGVSPACIRAERFGS